MDPGIPVRLVKTRRDYNTWAANETLEDYALRYAPASFRKWSAFQVGNTAFGAVSFLVLEAIGGALVIHFGFVNALWAIFASGLLIFLTGLPIAYYCARYNVDIDLLTRGAGFGYLGSTVTSLIYASFTFIFFALEASVMAFALRMAFDIPFTYGAIISALFVIPFVTHGISTISRLQAYTQPVWLVLMAIPLIDALRDSRMLAAFTHYGGQAHAQHFTPLLFGAGVSVCLSLMAQIGEQADYLRFMPAPTPGRRLGWWTTVITSGAGWIVPGMIKQLAGALLAFWLIHRGMDAGTADQPTQMYLVAYRAALGPVPLALTATIAFVILSQLKINVTNAYAGSLAWSNFFSRLTHAHPGRVVWLIFNVAIALLLMELRVFAALVHVLDLFAGFVAAWIGALIADLVINKPLGLSPRGVEFRRAYLYDINPVGVGATAGGALLGLIAHIGALGPLAAAFSPVAALAAAFVLSPIISAATGGRYYQARGLHPTEGTCALCRTPFAPQDMAHCPAYEGAICSLCCTLESRCRDACKPHAQARQQLAAWLAPIFPTLTNDGFTSRLTRFLVVFGGALLTTAAILGTLYYQGQLSAGPFRSALTAFAVKTYAALAVTLGLASWWWVLTLESRRRAEDESLRHNALLAQEIAEHAATHEQLKAAYGALDEANRAKRRFISHMSHELRTPLNSLLGYTEILLQNPVFGPPERRALTIMQDSGLHLRHLIEDILDVARIESGRVTLDRTDVALGALLTDVLDAFRAEALGRGLDLTLATEGPLPALIHADERRLRQILLNLIGNALKFTSKGGVTVRVFYRHQLLHIAVTDTGPGLSPEEMGALFQPFFRGPAASTAGQGGCGLGLTITKMLVEVMGGDIRVDNTPQGATFRVRLYCASRQAAATATIASRPTPPSLPTMAPPAHPTPATASTVVPPAREDVLVLLEQARLGYVKGLIGQLESLVARDPRHRAFAERVLALAHGFRMREIMVYLEAINHDAP
ncbi:MAG: ATP-binding protein [Acidiferrobacter sp.]